MKTSTTSICRASLLSGASACGPSPKTCALDTECGAGFRCEKGVCSSVVDGGGTGGQGGGVANPCATVTCAQEWEECLVGAGASCVSRFMVLEWTRSADAGPYGLAGPVPLELKLTLRPGASTTGFVPAALSHAVDGVDAGQLLRSGQTTQFGPKQLPVTGLSIGMHTASASYAGPTARKPLSVDVTAPVVTLSAQAAPTRAMGAPLEERDPDLAYATAHKKDEVPEVVVESTRLVVVARSGAIPACPEAMAPTPNGKHQLVIRVDCAPADPGVFDGGVAAATPPAAGVTATPAVGRGGDIFIVDDVGGVAACDASLQTQRWVLPAASGIAGGRVDSNASLDARRDGVGAEACGRGGVLHMPSAGDGGLYAFGVDPDGLDALAPWLKHQRDPANTGNPATLLAPWTCP